MKNWKIDNVWTYPAAGEIFVTAEIQKYYYAKLFTKF